jgi:hypothetical protein
VSEAAANRFHVLTAAEVQRLHRRTLSPIVVLELYTPKSL